MLAVVDFGFSCAEFARRADSCGIDVGEISAVFFTHDHADHCAGLAAFHRRHPEVPLYANSGTADAIAERTGVDDGWQIFENGAEFEIGDVKVKPFPIPHDAADPVGYLFRDDRRTLFVGTDIGTITASVRAALSQADCAVLESNHDPELLMASDRPISTKARIAGRSGHLSNDDAAELIAAARASSLKTILLAHLSRDCNDPALALGAMRTAIAKAGCASAALAALSQDEPSALYEF